MFHSLCNISWYSITFLTACVLSLIENLTAYFYALCVREWVCVCAPMQMAIQSHSLNSHGARSSNTLAVLQLGQRPHSIKIVAELMCNVYLVLEKFMCRHPCSGNVILDLKLWRGWIIIIFFNFGMAFDEINITDWLENSKVQRWQQSAKLNTKLVQLHETNGNDPLGVLANEGPSPMVLYWVQCKLFYLSSRVSMI